MEVLVQKNEPYQKILVCWELVATYPNDMVSLVGIQVLAAIT